MPTYWNFREILDVHPEWDKQCVAINVNTEKRCGIVGWNRQQHLGDAINLLNKMDRTLSLDECRGHLDRLAFLLMCGHPHRKMTEVQKDRRRRWNKQISAYIASDIRNKTGNAQGDVAGGLVDGESTHRVCFPF
jgi:hypothetical protein